MNPQDPPRVLGILLSLLGIVLSGMELFSTAYLGGGVVWYFVLVGLGYATCGILLFKGRSEAVPVYALILLAVWVWSVSEARTDLGQLLPRVALPTLLGLYIFSPSLRSRLVSDSAPPDKSPLDAQASSRVDRWVEGLSAFAGIAPRLLTWFVLAFAAKEIFAAFKPVGASAPVLIRLLYVVWIASPLAAVGWVLLRFRRSFLQDAAILFASVMLAYFGTGAYYINLSPSSTLADTNVFLWVPLAQWVWTGGWFHLLKRGIG